MKDLPSTKRSYKAEASTKKVESVCTYPVIPSSLQLKKTMDGLQFKMFGVGNEKRDLTLLIRGDLRILTPVENSFFGCLNCGFIGFKCSCKCQNSSMCSVDGVWKGSTAELRIGEKSTDVTIIKM